MEKITLSATTLEFRPVADKHQDVVAVLSLHRPQAANAFNGEMVQELTTHLNTAAKNARCRLLVLKGTGRNFCAGADLNWMKDFAALNFAQNVAEAKVLSNMYEALYHFPRPTIAVVQGAAYGGAVGLVAACDTAIATEDARFCLSEVRVGLIPAVILPYVAKKISTGQMQRHTLSGRVFKAAEAKEFGLVQQVCAPLLLAKLLEEGINQFLLASPEAQAMAKLLYHELQNDGFSQSEKTADAIAKIRTSSGGQAGIKAFFNKQKPSWALELTNAWTTDD